MKAADTHRDSIKDIKYYSAGRRRLVLRRFTRHRLSMVGMLVLALMGLAGVFAEFLAPYGRGPMDGMRDTSYIQGPPQIPRFRNANGLSLRPHVIAMTTERDPVTLRRRPVPLLIASADDGEPQPIYRPLMFFVRGDAYRFLGIIPCDRPLFGAGAVDEALLAAVYGEPALDNVRDDLAKAQQGKIHLFGTDSIGNDLFSQVIFATRTSLSIGVLGVFTAFILALIIGGIAGYFGGWIDFAVQRVTEVVRVVPTIPLFMGLAASFPKEWSNMRVYFIMTMIFGLFGWPTLARRIRSQLLSLRNEDYVVSAKISGARTVRIIGRHLLPAFTSYIIVDLVISFPYMILSETALSFIGLGLRRPSLSWGVLLHEAQSIRALEQAPWFFIPLIFVVAAVLAFTVMGDGLRDAADPYHVQRAR